MNTLKKMMFVAIAILAFNSKSVACWDYSLDADYYNLFTQEIMNDPRYRAFLMTFDSRFYPTEPLRNGNIEEWQNYLGLTYDQTAYLVFKSTRESLQNLTKNKPVSDKNLSFATPEFVKNHKQALLYLAYCKYLEPYMRVVPSGESNGYWDFYDDYEHNAGDLDYAKVKKVLTQSYAAETDKELKLRYGYQLVRLAHYTRRFGEAVKLFDQYVEPLNMKTEMYYYALSQKAGALRGLGKTKEANRAFVSVFANSTDLKQQAYSSMTLGWDTEVSFADFLATAADDNERNDIYLMLGYSDFNNPVNEIEKIIANNPDAIQAKVLMVRSINNIERNLLKTWLPDDEKTPKSRYPYWYYIDENDPRPFFKQTLSVCDKQVGKAKDGNFWNLASSYLHFLNHDYDKASTALSNVKPSDELYKTMVRNISTYLDICRPERITSEVEKDLFARYKDVITSSDYELYEKHYCFNVNGESFVSLVLTNRYALQGDNAKSFLVDNHIRAIEDNPKEKLLNEIQTFLNKKNKNPMEEYLAAKSTSEIADYNNYISYVKGVLRLTDGNFKEAKSFFDKQTRLKVSKRIFGHNIRVWYSGKEYEIMRDDYISEFSFIRDNMTEADVANALMQLQKIAEKGKGDISAKANYLIANFFYNVSQTGYFRQYLRFDSNNAWCYSKYSFDVTEYKNTTKLSNDYLNRAQKCAVDDDLKAHIVFALAKNAQQDLEREGNSEMMSVPQSLFREMDKYQKTNYYGDVVSTCAYFEAYHNGYFDN